MIWLDLAETPDADAEVDWLTPVLIAEGLADD